MLQFILYNTGMKISWNIWEECLEAEYQSCCMNENRQAEHVMDVRWRRNEQFKSLYQKQARNLIRDIGDQEQINMHACVCYYILYFVRLVYIDLQYAAVSVWLE
jgi:hypothetical protein